MTTILLTILALFGLSGWLAWFRVRSKKPPRELSELKAFQRHVVMSHLSAFKLHQDVLVTLEDAFTTSRSRPTRHAIAVEMLMYQAFKSDEAVAVLAKHGLLEDTATIARRLMELAVQALYLGADGDKMRQEERSSRYLAHLWRKMDSRGRDKMPAEIKKRWEDISTDVGNSLPADAVRWGPRWKRMFEEAGALEMYNVDYPFLSAMAHGSPDDLILFFSLVTQRVHRHEHAWVLLWYATKYFLMVAIQWNNALQVVPDATMENLIDRTNNWERPTQ